MADFPAFVNAGIDTFDMGPEACGYGPAETIVGAYLKSAAAAALPPPLLFTKLCCVGGEQSNMSRDFVRGRVDTALSRLGSPPRVDLMQVYWNDYTYQQQLIDASLFLMDEKAAGRVRAGACGRWRVLQAQLRH